MRKQIGHGFIHLCKILTNVPTSDIVYCWFASVYGSLAVIFAKMFGIKTVIVLGGVDIAKNPVLGYGIWLSWWRAKIVRAALVRADRVFISDGTMKEDTIRLAEYSGSNIAYLPAAFDTEFWKPGGEKENEVLTVASVSDRRTVLRKGLNVLIEAARVLPEMRFIVVGMEQKYILEFHPPENIRFHGQVPRKELLAFYQKAKVYCQPSIHESFCYTLREAMLCGCIPVASNVGGMPTAVSGVGMLVPPENTELLVASLLQAMKGSKDTGVKARARIVALYAKDKRERELPQYLEELTA